MKQITKKIILYKVLTKEKKEIIKEAQEILPTDKLIALLDADSVIADKVQLYTGEHTERLEVLSGKTYKIKPSISEHAYYITINNIELDGKLYPFELFINSKGIEHYKLLGFARLVSAILRKGGNISFLTEELKQIYDPIGAYTSKRTYENGKRKRFNSIEAEIGDIIAEHLASLEEKNNTFVDILQNELGKISTSLDIPLEKLTKDMYLYEEPATTGFPSNATICSKCSYKAVVILDGCATCLNCGDSKCN